MGLAQCYNMLSPYEMVIPHEANTLRGFLNDYDIFDEVLGEGEISIVRPGFNKLSGESVAVKVINKAGMDHQDEFDLKMEIDLLRRLKHSNIVQLLDFFEEPLTYMIVMERVDGGDLFQRLVKKSQYPEREARECVRSILSAVKYIHDRSIVHRDIRPENLLLVSADDDCTVKLADFGLATEAGGDCLTQQYGTPEYIAPEILMRKAYGRAVDMWSVGAVAYCLLGGYPPFHHSAKRELFRKIREGSYDFPALAWGGVSEEAKEFIRRLLVVDPAARYTVEQALVDPWVLYSKAGHVNDIATDDMEEPSISVLESEPATMKIHFNNDLQSFSSVREFHDYL